MKATKPSFLQKYFASVPLREHFQQNSAPYEELLDIYHQVGQHKGKAMIDALAFGF